ncbi:MAG: L,D-transpeptidase [Hyphomicrobiaceae bacterium]|nr:L,D-transpeptidase [Hyphomicrobiaceae bacterium]
MRLLYSGWVALTGILLMVPPATATPTGSSPEPVMQTAATPPTTAPAPAPAGEAVPATLSPGGIKGEPKADPQPDAGSEPAALQMPAIEPEPPKPVVTLKVDIDLSAQRMTVKNGGDVLHVWPISSGRRGYFTPNGTYQPQWRAKMWRSRQYYGAPMPHAVFFHRGYAVHGTYATGMLGRPASHGCIRLAPKNAAAFYKLVGQHGMESTEIVVRGKANVASPKVARSRKSGSRTRQASSSRRSTGGYAGYGAPWWTW